MVIPLWSAAAPVRLCADADGNAGAWRQLGRRFLDFDGALTAQVSQLVVLPRRNEGCIAHLCGLIRLADQRRTHPRLRSAQAGSRRVTAAAGWKRVIRQVARDAF